MKKILLILAVLLVYVPAFLCAQSRVVDNAGVLSASEKAGLEKQLADIAATYYFDLVVVTEKAINTQARAYADDFFDKGGYGADGCLFLRVTGSRDYYFSTSGRGEKILNNTAYSKLESDVGSFLDSNDLAGAFYAFLNTWEEFLVLDANGRSYNFFYRWNLLLVLIGWVLAILIGLGVVYTWKAQMNTAIPQKQADPYIIPNSLAFTGKKDSFLYTQTTKTKRESSSSSTIGGAHISSSGRSHGGRGGRR